MITVLGSSGFIGSHIVEQLKNNNDVFYAPARGETLFEKDLGHVIYCIGLTADFRVRPFDTIEAHVCLLNRILKEASFDSLTYLSSTRVYISCKDEASENSKLVISMDDPNELYTLSKLTGERLCLSSGRKTKIIRLSNVLGLDATSENFINNIITSLQKDRQVNFATTLSSSKDYISVSDVVELSIKIALHGKSDLYNVASGFNISNDEIISILKKYYQFDYTFSTDAKEIIFPKINIDKIKDEFNYSPSNTKSKLEQLIKSRLHDTDR